MAVELQVIIGSRTEYEVLLEKINEAEEEGEITNIQVCIITEDDDDE